MLSDLGWQQLKDRRKHIRLALFYKIVHHLIAVPHEDILRKADSRTRSSHNYKYRTLRSYKDPYIFSFFSPDYTGMESPASGYSAFGHHWYFLKTGSTRHRRSARPPPALSWPPAFSWPLPAFRQPHLGPILPHGGLPSIRQVKSSQWSRIMIQIFTDNRVERRICFIPKFHWYVRAMYAIAIQS